MRAQADPSSVTNILLRGVFLFGPDEVVPEVYRRYADRGAYDDQIGTGKRVRLCNVCCSPCFGHVCSQQCRDDAQSLIPPGTLDTTVLARVACGPDPAS